MTDERNANLKEDMVSIARGIEQMEAGEGRPLAESDVAMREALGFPEKWPASVDPPC